MVHLKVVDKTCHLILLSCIELIRRIRKATKKDVVLTSLMVIQASDTLGAQQYVVHRDVARISTMRRTL
jgi:hypothetical protein